MSTEGMMSIERPIAGNIAFGVFLIIFGCIVLAAETTASPYYGLTVFLISYFPISLLVSIAVIGIFFGLLSRMNSTSDEIIGLSDKNIKDKISELVMGAIAFVVVGTGTGIFHRSLMETGDASGANPKILLGMWLSVFYMFGFPLYLSYLGRFLVGNYPIWIAGYVALTTTHPATGAVTRSLGRKQPDYVIERELWAIMSRQDATDLEIERKFRELSSLRQMILQFQYKARAKEARKLRDMAAAQTEAYRAEGDLAGRLHEYERMRRARGGGS